MLRLWFIGLAGIAACSVGAVEIASDSPAGACTERIVPAAAPHAHTPDNATRAGEGCQTAGCHSLPLGSGAPEFLLSGTVYKPDNTTPASGIEIRVEPDGDGVTAIATTDSAGNFFITVSDTNPFPGRAFASGCPTDDARMVTALPTRNEGNCNSGGCHQNPGGGSGPINFADD